MFNDRLEKKARFAAFDNFREVSGPTEAKSKLLMGHCHWMWGWKETLTHGSSEPVPRHQFTPGFRSPVPVPLHTRNVCQDPLPPLARLGD